ncbi:hypothetical protein [Halosimplex halobium]|uniref:hypothetical protein n=1 Tax=Halosimplex halobium TaxID=3396618 RepID=UPI003F557EBC
MATVEAPEGGFDYDDPNFGYDSEEEAEEASPDHQREKAQVGETGATVTHREYQEGMTAGLSDSQKEQFGEYEYDPIGDQQDIKEVAEKRQDQQDSGESSDSGSSSGSGGSDSGGSGGSGSSKATTNTNAKIPERVREDIQERTNIDVIDKTGNVVGGAFESLAPATKDLIEQRTGGSDSGDSDSSNGGDSGDSDGSNQSSGSSSTGQRDVTTTTVGGGGPKQPDQQNQQAPPTTESDGSQSSDSGNPNQTVESTGADQALGQYRAFTAGSGGSGSSGSNQSDSDALGGFDPMLALVVVLSLGGAYAVSQGGT